MKIMLKQARQRGITKIEVVVIAVGLPMLFLLLPGLFTYSPRARARAPRIQCTNNLKQIGIAYKTWSLDQSDRFPMEVPGNDASITNRGTKEWIPSGLAAPHFRIISNELNSPKILVCPADKQRAAAKDFGAGFNNSHLSYFIGVDVDDRSPQMFMAGDRNLTTNGVPLAGGGLYTLRSNTIAGFTDQIHGKSGNVLLVDGSVQQWTSAALRAALPSTGIETNRLAVP